MGKITVINGARIVTPDGVVENGTMVVKENVIAEIGATRRMGDTTIEAEGRWVLPGIVDSHSDAIEHEMFPRPTSYFPLETSFYELERKLVGQGITTIYHSLSMWGDERRSGSQRNEARRNEAVFEYIKRICRLREERRMIRHNVHLRYEMTNIDGLPYVRNILEQGCIDQLSFMDHTPGQGQYRDSAIQLNFIMEKQNKNRDEAMAMLEMRKSFPKTDEASLLELAALARAKGIPLASHDDDSIEKLDRVTEWQAVISEFPVDLEVAVEAKRRGLYTVMGAPNVLLGRSHSNNLSALEAIGEGVVDILCSDYYPPAMLQAVFALHRLGYELPYAVNMVSLNPARALGIDSRTGSLEVGKEADLLLVNEHSGKPFIEKVWAGGELVCQMSCQLGTALAAR
ncbi:alpha-D-ribose 1-methylphosphonate 5-triphosphate diphosphatase [Cohnella zeiphila]|uniref:Alpha-D-ribose 1-methylphosphonate 5-triphosphate diphosphatase n=1 Tax=Cohnella zeiphila TaxID=2761120 RepID=A0A7X0STZ7_9BACL|nr:alpha-D-ribose 1-methylphosphonate 5-triphosphate diphosphatase [Cohnella zeiphila]MBB6735104.1 alpha-D-ribose 1-methylphosphonate 5-triphosphate diphosphatase [Cohnella zeiphila]